jgi:hypothetical protein
MLTHPTIDQLKALRLDGMAEALIELQSQTQAADLSHAEWLALLLDRELAHRNTKRFKSRLRPPVPKDMAQISRSKPYRLRRAPVGFTKTVLDGYGLRDRVPARPTVPASYPISVRQVATLLHASFRRTLAEPPLRFASAAE